MKKKKKMSRLVKKFPALCLFVLAALLGLAPSLPAAAGLIPPAFMQLGALSASLAGIILTAIEGRKGGVKELLRRALIWRVGLEWWVFVLLFPALLAVVTLYSAPPFRRPERGLERRPSPLYSLAYAAYAHPFRRAGRRVWLTRVRPPQASEALQRAGQRSCRRCAVVAVAHPYVLYRGCEPV
jgi:hypothetical protein